MKLAERMKAYESVSRGQLVRRIPVIIRVDGRAFHTLTKGCDKPFDKKIMDSMVNAAASVANDMQGFKLAYIQSDEATFLLTDYDDLETQGWFDYKLSKIVSMSAAMMSVYFSKYYKREAFFDSRAFNVPREEIANAFLWRAQDWKRNSLQMYARSNFSHKQLHKKNSSDLHDLLHSIGKNWATDLTDQQKNGTFITAEGDRFDILPTYESIKAIADF
jgi:tRNA(His) 5'-end guanylyltransferase